MQTDTVVALVVTTNAVNTLLGSGVGVDHVLGQVADAGAAAVGVLADLHTLDILVGVLGLDGGDIPAGPGVAVGQVTAVLAVAEVELTPGAGVATHLVGGELGALGGTPATLGVAVEGNVLGLAGVDGQGEGGAAAVPSVDAAVRADLVPEDHGPGVLDATVNGNHVAVVAGVGLGHLLDVATPGAADVALVEDVVLVVVQGARAETLTRELAAGGVVMPVAAAAASGSRGRGRGRGRGRLAGSGDGSDGHDLGGTALSLEGRGGSRLGGSSGGGSAGPLVGPGDHLAVHLDLDQVTETTLLDGVSMATLVAVQTGSGRAGGQSREEENRILELHCGYEEKRIQMGIVSDRSNGAKAGGYHAVY